MASFTPVIEKADLIIAINIPVIHSLYTYPVITRLEHLVPDPLNGTMVEPSDTQKKRFQLDDPVEQASGTYQCWWLSLLEIARASDKLDYTFLHEEGTLRKYFTDKKIPDKGELPPDHKAPKAKPKKEDDKSKKEKPGDREVYGPEWQRMIMYFLKTTTWRHNADDTVMTSSRPAELKELLKVLGVTGIDVTTITPINLVSGQVATKITDFQLGQRLLVDRKGTNNESHCMSGIVESDPQGPAFKLIKVYNQSTGNTFPCRVIQDKKDKNDKVPPDYLVTPKGRKLNWILPVGIKP
ncbi:hypothetical protein TWF696_007759 [Orbilia brochopaga]|uniref:Uncharacterized protein n=1 Tax=Orbilia brochopaga TaxID=3140254 RepID=A0AAV9ULA3_9PEZI